MCTAFRTVLCRKTTPSLQQLACMKRQRQYNIYIIPTVCPSDPHCPPPGHCKYRLIRFSQSSVYEGSVTDVKNMFNYKCWFGVTVSEDLIYHCIVEPPLKKENKLIFFTIRHQKQQIQSF